MVLEPDDLPSGYEGRGLAPSVSPSGLAGLLFCENSASRSILIFNRHLRHPVADMSTAIEVARKLDA